ncbi:MAG: YjfB family protein [Acidaminococcales bacterium]|nr:YjfB family protein [Acidaminococcales bacterium]
MGLDPIVDMAVKMKYQSVKEQASFSIMKMALDLAEQSGQDILKMTESVEPAPAPLGNFPGNIIDILA